MEKFKTNQTSNRKSLYYDLKTVIIPNGKQSLLLNDESELERN